jgi:hypothetical protein
MHDRVRKITARFLKGEVRHDSVTQLSQHVRDLFDLLPFIQGTVDIGQKCLELPVVVEHLLERFRRGSI